jgi:3-deoxy-manno-octulosonate cytidylyltransferase (CMP-KDO synthetase)
VVKNRKVAIIIPARYASTRLKGKLMIEVLGKPIIQWVWEIARKSELADDVIIATDNKEIFDKASAFGAKVEMTSIDHKSGSDRICEVLNRNGDFDYVVNLQGDEPSITPEVIDLAIKNLVNSDADISTLVREITPEQAENPNCVKCVLDNAFNALYFSRSKIPYERNAGAAKIYGHIGIYGYKRDVLIKLTSLPQADLELAESLEQLRALKNGFKIRVGVTSLNPIGIDTKEDLEEFKKRVCA